MRLAVYVSGHGLGHASRVVEVLNALRGRRPDIDITIRSPAPAWFFDFNLTGAAPHTTVALDIGVVQPHSLAVDPVATLEAYARMASRRQAIVSDEIAALRAYRPRVVLADIPALAFDVAARLDVPGIALANFSWDWIYADYAADHPRYDGLVRDIRRSYGKATLLLRLPLHGDMSAFPNVRDLPLVARHARLPRAEVRQRLALPPAAPVVLVSFGALGAPPTAPPSLPPGVILVTTDGPAPGAAPGWCRTISRETLRTRGVRYEDLVAAADAVLTKPGYGIVAECIANATPIVYTPRGRFAEYPYLVRGIETHLSHAELGTEDLHAGRWRDALDAVLAQTRRVPTVATDGATVAADVLLEFLDPA